MIDRLSAKAAKILCDAVNSNEKYSLYEYAFFILFSEAMHTITVLILGVCLSLFVESAIYYISFIMVRKFAGGYHAKTPAKCFIFSIGIGIAALLLIKLFVYANSPITIMLAIISFILVVVCSPVENENKALCEKEKKVYRYIAIGISAILLVLVCILQAVQLNSFAIPISLGLTTAAFVAAAGKTIRKKAN